MKYADVNLNNIAYLEDDYDIGVHAAMERLKQRGMPLRVTNATGEVADAYLALDHEGGVTIRTSFPGESIAPDVENGLTNLWKLPPELNGRRLMELLETVQVADLLTEVHRGRDVYTDEANKLVATLDEDAEAAVEELDKLCQSLFTSELCMVVWSPEEWLGDEDIANDWTPGFTLDQAAWTNESLAADQNVVIGGDLKGALLRKLRLAVDEKGYKPSFVQKKELGALTAARDNLAGALRAVSGVVERPAGQGGEPSAVQAAQAVQRRAMRP